ncbi:MAG: TIM-barrel domain-containing protein [Myxococcota bacterium]
MRRFLLLGAVALAGCGPSTPTLGGFTLDARERSFEVRFGDAVLLDTSEGDGQAAPVSVATSKARYEMQYGSWRITDGKADLVTGRRFQWDRLLSGRADGHWVDPTGAVIVRLSATSPGPGALAMVFEAADPAVNRLAVSFTCRDDDHYLGFGGQADGIDHMGQTVPIWTSEPGIGKQLENDDSPDLWFLVGTRHASSYGLPTWLSNRGYVGVVESDRRSVFELCSGPEKVFRIEVWANRFTLWLFHGNVPMGSLSAATAFALGRPQRPPPMAFAPWNDAIKGPGAVRALAALLRDNDIPSSAIWTEDFRGGTEEASGYRLVEDWDLDRTLYPDAEGLAAELSAQGLAWHAYFNTFLVEGNPVYDAALAGGHFVKNASGEPYLFSGVTFKPTGLADLSRPETREFVKSYMRGALDAGFTGWMADYGEWLPHDAVLASGEDPLEAHNRYPLEWAKLNDEVLAERRSDGVQRTFFARAGWLKSNAVTPVVWAGDQRTSFQADDGLPTVIPMGLNLGLAGVSTFGHDIAGYQSATNPPSTKELFFRWVTLGALSPVMRTHHGIRPADNWRLDSDAETLAHYKRWAKLHTQLFPYLDAHAAEAEATGVPIWRALPLMFPNDAATWTVADEYMLGGALLVAPVVTEGATSRGVHLPPGEWVSWDGSKRYAGPGDVVVDAPLTEAPVFIRVGAVIPLLPDRVDTFLPAEPPTVDLDDVKAERRLRVVVGSQSQFAERDGTRYTFMPGDSTDFYEANVKLADCAAAEERGCVDRSGPHPLVRLKGDGPLDVPGGYLVIDSPVTRTWDVEVL